MHAPALNTELTEHVNVAAEDVDKITHDALDRTYGLAHAVPAFAHDAPVQVHAGVGHNDAESYEEHDFTQLPLLNSYPESHDAPATLQEPPVHPHPETAPHKDKSL